MKHHARLIVLFTLALALVIVPVSTASAAPTANNITCEISPWNPTGNAPLTVNFDASKSTGAAGYTWIFPEIPAMMVGPQVQHTYNYPGAFKVTLICLGTDGSSTMRVSTWIQVQAGTMSAATPIVSVTPPAPTTSSVATATGTSVNVTGSIQGDNNIAPVINGDGNRVTIDLSAPTATPVPAPVYTTPKSFFWQFIKSILDWIASPLNSWRDWIVEHK